MAFDKIIRGGTVVTTSGRVRADIAIQGEKIAAIGTGLGRANETIDAKGHLVLPGVIDVHVHLDLPIRRGLKTSDDFLSGTRAAAAGGVTTIIDFATPYPKGNGKYETLSEAADVWFERADGKAIVDYTYHLCITNWKQHQREVPAMIERGFPTFKEFMIYAERGVQSDDGDVFGTLEMMADEGGLLLIHAESANMLDELIARHHTKPMMKKYGARLHPMTRPNFIEAEAIQRAITWADITGGPLYIVHMSTGEGADLIKQAQAKGTPVISETCPQYLVLDDSVFEGKDGHLFCTQPQVKKPEDSERLWEGLRGGEVSVISTDTCTFNRKQKALWKGDWTKTPMGMPGLETLLPIVYTHGVLGGQLTVEEMCVKLSTNPAKIMGLYPRKGAIEIGADADIAIIHPTNTKQVDPKKMETNCDWSPYQGWDLAGFARTTLSRGEVIVDDYTVTAKKGRGQWLPRRSL